MHNKSTLDQIQQPEFKKETTKGTAANNRRNLRNELGTSDKATDAL